MPNDIPTRQNSTDALLHFTASRRLYALGKRVANVQFFVAAGVPLAAAAAMLYIPSDQTKAAFAFVGIAAALLEGVVLDRLQRAYRAQGVLEQELFDCIVLELPWPAALAGPRPSRESTRESSEQFARRHPAPTGFRDWYPVAIEQLDIARARIACQRCNAWWDGRLRQRYAAAIGVFVAAVILLVLAIGLWRSTILSELVLTVYAPASPLIMWGLKERIRQTEAARLSEQVRTRADEVWRNTLAENPGDGKLLEFARDIQDATFVRRRTAPFTPDWINGLHRKRYLEVMATTVGDMVSEALAASQPSSPATAVSSKE